MTAQQEIEYLLAKADCLPWYAVHQKQLLIERINSLMGPWLILQARKAFQAGLEGSPLPQSL